MAMKKMQQALRLDGPIVLQNIDIQSNIVGYGQIYPKADNLLYYRPAVGDEVILATTADIQTAALTPGSNIDITGTTISVSANPVFDGITTGLISITSNTITLTNGVSIILGASALTYNMTPSISDNNDITNKLYVDEAIVTALGALTTDHNSLTGLNTGDYMHLTAAEYASFGVALSDITTLQGQMTTAQGDISTLQGQVSTIQTDLGTATSNITTLQGQVSTLQTDLGTAQGNITTLQGQMTTAQGDITTLQGQVTTAQGDITTLQGQVTTIQTALLDIPTLSGTNNFTGANTFMGTGPTNINTAGNFGLVSFSNTPGVAAAYTSAPTITADQDITNKLYVDTSISTAISGATLVAGTNINITTGTISVIDSPTFAGTVTVSGDLFVNGTQFITNTQTVEVADNIIVLNKGELNSQVTAGVSGIKVDRGTGTPYFFLFDEVRDAFVLGHTTTEGAADVATLQVVATRENAPQDLGIAYWDATTNKFITSSFLSTDLAGDTIYLNGSAITATKIVAWDQLVTDSATAFVRTDVKAGQGVDVVVSGSDVTVTNKQAVQTSSIINGSTTTDILLSASTYMSAIVDYFMTQGTSSQEGTIRILNANGTYQLTHEYQNDTDTTISFTGANATGGLTLVANNTDVTTGNITWIIRGILD